MAASAIKIGHTLRVRALYKAILRIHRGMPVQLQVLGNQYVKDEFKRNKVATIEQTQTFMMEWTKYYVTMVEQLSTRTVKPQESLVWNEKHRLGENLSPELLDCFLPDQIMQLHELLEESKKPVPLDNSETSYR